MNTLQFYSPWHSCLYGVGGIVSKVTSRATHLSMREDIVAILMQDDLQPLTSNDKVYEVGAAIHYRGSKKRLDSKASGVAGKDFTRLCLLAEASGNQSTYSRELFAIVSHLNRLEEAELAGLDDREVYDLLMAFSFYLTLIEQGAILSFEQALPNPYFIGHALLQIKNPFFYSRACGLICSQLARLRTKNDQYDWNGLLNLATNIANRFISDSSGLMQRGHDGVHGPADYIVFSSTILGQGLQLLEAYNDGPPSEEYLLLKQMANEQYSCCMPIESQMSQYLFYRGLFLDSSEDLMGLDDGYFNLAKAYLGFNKQNDPYDYLRIAYMLFQIGGRNDLSSDLYQLMVSRLIARLDRTCNSIAYSESTNKKYDNDILSYCYCYMLWHYLDDSILGSKVIETFEHIQLNLNKLSALDLHKLYLTQYGVKNNTTNLPTRKTVNI